MKTPRIANAISHIDEELINNAVKTQKTAKKTVWIKWSSFAACFTVLLIVAAVAVPTFFEYGNTTLPILSGNNTTTNNSEISVPATKDNGTTTSPTVNQNTTHINNAEPTTSGGNDNTTIATNNDSTTQAVIDNEEHTTGNSNQQEHNAQTTEPVELSTAVATTIANNKEQEYIYKDVIVGYDTAKAYFKHSILPCNRNDFTGYSVLLVIPNENNNESGTDCLSLTYLFTNGSVDLRDQNKTGKVTPTGKQYEYRGRTFYVHTPEFNGDQIRIGYYPTGESGIAYKAHFNSRSDINEIIDLILSLELKK